MQIRMSIGASPFAELVNAATIAIRYSTVWKQGFKDTAVADPFALGEGRTVLDYKTQQYRILSRGRRM